MKKVVLYLLLAGVLCLVVGVVGLRVAAGYIVSTAEFRSQVNSLLETTLRPVVPGAVVEVREAELKQVATLELRYVMIRAGKHLTEVASVPKVRLTPRLLTLLADGDATFDAEVAL